MLTTISATYISSHPLVEPVYVNYMLPHQALSSSFYQLPQLNCIF